MTTVKEITELIIVVPSLYKWHLKLYREGLQSTEFGIEFGNL
jgi:hypothetical protein